jgi:hypothetical protein
MNFLFVAAVVSVVIGEHNFQIAARGFPKLEIRLLAASLLKNISIFKIIYSCILLHKVQIT